VWQISGLTQHASSAGWRATMFWLWKLRLPISLVRNAQSV
jgi:hypothetical protein